MKDSRIEPYQDNKQRDFEREEAYIRAKKKVEKIVGFYWHALWYVLVNIFIIFMIVRNMDADENFWSFRVFSTAFFWGIGLVFHFISVFGPNFLFGKQWEQRQIDKYMEEDKKRWE
ncbi:2TM domain-containing protein [uncultured Lacinutrix sp.]|uniref:2TM domain-containing protein n=1 Tax=uncultured Lacinutrix sp. TaxID=574032 RepID=UPI00262A87F7|nr:2TM domain-containing protein [uncultured Lacinutrix sp.]